MFNPLHLLFLLPTLSTLLTLTLAGTPPSPGCGTAPPTFSDPSTPELFLSSSGLNRSYYINLPPKYNPKKRYPLVLGFHASQSIGLYFPLDTKMNETKYSGDKIMVYPNGVNGTWAGPSYHNGTSVGEDVQFVVDVVEDVKGKFCVNTDKVFGVGMSNGGGFIGTLACDKQGSSLFQALASHSGAFYTDTNGPDNGCAPAKMMPMLEIHGAADKEVPYLGGKGEGGDEPPIQLWVDWWAQRNKCGSAGQRWTHNGAVRHVSWNCGKKKGAVQHYEVKDLGHCWADTAPNFSQMSVPQGPTVIVASEIIMKFFQSM